MTTEPADTARDSETQGTATDTGATVLVVDDERALVDIYRSWLQGEYTVRTASDGEEALEEMTASVDVVLLDRQMSGLTGGAVLEEIRERDLDCRVAMVTAIEPDVDVIGMGFDDYLTKPVSETEVRRTVRRLLELREYDAVFREYFALSSKLAILETNVDGADLESNDEYARLVERHSEIKRETEERLDRLLQNGDDERVIRQIVAGREPVPSGSGTR